MRSSCSRPSRARRSTRSSSCRRSVESASNVCSGSGWLPSYDDGRSHPASREDGLCTAMCSLMRKPRLITVIVCVSQGGLGGGRAVRNYCKQQCAPCFPENCHLWQEAGVPGEGDFHQYHHQAPGVAASEECSARPLCSCALRGRLGGRRRWDLGCRAGRPRPPPQGAAT